MKKDYVSAAWMASRLKISKTHLLNLVHKGRITPTPTRMNGGLRPWLFDRNSTIVKINRVDG